MPAVQNAHALTVGEILSLERIALDVDATSKKRALDTLSDLLADVDTNQRCVAERLMARERLGSTALGHGVAIPHGRAPNATAARAAFLRLRDGVDFDAPDGKPVDLVVGLLVPEACSDGHLQILAQLAEMFSQPQIREELRGDHSREGIWDIINQESLKA